MCPVRNVTYLSGRSDEPASEPIGRSEVNGGDAAHLPIASALPLPADAGRGDVTCSYTAPSRAGSDCLGCQAVCHGV